MSDLETIATTFSRCFFRINRLLDRRMMEQGASLARTKLLLYLDRIGPARSADIADFFSHSPRTVTEAIDGLERAGMVRRDPDPTDRRAKRVSITAAGRDAIATTEPLRLQLIEQVFGALTPPEREAMASMLQTLSTSLDALQASETPRCAD